MIIGYVIIAVPTGIVSAEYTQHMNDQAEKPKNSTSRCPNCGTKKLKDDAAFCYICGESL